LMTKMKMSNANKDEYGKALRNMKIRQHTKMMAMRTRTIAMTTFDTLPSTCRCLNSNVVL
jgi:hypothetical protein